jgi:hypothetical protein
MKARGLDLARAFGDAYGDAVPPCQEKAETRMAAATERALSRKDRFAKVRATYGEVPERSIGAVSKTVVRASVPWVRIPPSPPANLFAQRDTLGVPSGRF